MSDDQSGQSGFEAVLEMFRVMDEEERARLLRDLAEKDPSLTQRLRENLFLFEDIVKLEPNSIPQLVGKFPVQKWAIALKLAGSDVRKFLFENLSKRAVDDIQEELQGTQKHRKSEVLQVQAEIAHIAKDFPQSKDSS